MPLAERKDPTFLDAVQRSAERAYAMADSDPGKIDLIVDIATGEVWVDGNAASISGFQIVSNANSLVPGDLVPAVPA